MGFVGLRVGQWLRMVYVEIMGFWVWGLWLYLLGC